MYKKLLFLSTLIIILAAGGYHYFPQKSLPIIAIANYGPHASLEDSITGFKEEMAKQGFIHNQNIRYELRDVGFDSLLIPQMVNSLRQYHPKVMVVMTTPVAQYAKSKIHDIPLVYSAITDPVTAGLIKKANKSEANVTGSSDMQDLSAFLQFATTLIPQSKSVGLLYSSSESNDAALVNMMQTAAATLNLSVVAIPVDQARDVPLRITEFKGKVDFIYVGASGPIQPTLPAISAAAKKMGIPVFNVEEQAVRNNLALASFGVNYKAVGRNTGKLVAAILRGEKVSDLNPLYPTTNDYQSMINRKKAAELKLSIPKNIEIVEE